MPRGKRAVGFGAGTVVAVTLLLSGCASTTTTRPTSTPVTTPTPAFTSDADATAAAIAFYKKYLKVANAIAESNTKPSSALRPFLSPEQFRSEAGDVAALRASGDRTGGPLRLKKLEAQQVRHLAGELSAYVCLDATRAPILDKAGKDVSPKGRAVKTTLLVTFSGLPGNSRIDSSELWSGRSIC